MKNSILPLHLSLGSTLMSTFFSQECFCMMHLLGYILPSEAQTGLLKLVQNVGHTQAGLSFSILQVEYGLLEHLMSAQVFRPI